LLLAAKSRARICQGEVDFAGTRFESFPLRELRHDVSLRTFAAPTALQTSAVLGNGADVQIGGDVRVGDALQAIVGSNLIGKVRIVVLCRNFSKRGISASFASNKRDTHQPTEKRARGGACGHVRIDGAEVHGVTAEQL
jgi:hypothetical protein